MILKFRISTSRLLVVDPGSGLAAFCVDWRCSFDFQLLDQKGPRSPRCKLFPEYPKALRVLIQSLAAQDQSRRKMLRLMRDDRSNVTPAAKTTLRSLVSDNQCSTYHCTHRPIVQSQRARQTPWTIDLVFCGMSEASPWDGPALPATVDWSRRYKRHPLDSSSGMPYPIFG